MVHQLKMGIVRLRDQDVVPVHCGDLRWPGLCPGQKPWTSRRRMQGRSQNTALNASDRNNFGVPIINPFYNMEYNIIKKRTKKGWIQGEMPSINLTPNRNIAHCHCHCLCQQCRRNPVNSVMSQLNTLLIQGILASLTVIWCICFTRIWSFYCCVYKEITCE